MPGYSADSVPWAPPSPPEAEAGRVEAELRGAELRM